MGGFSRIVSRSDISFKVVVSVCVGVNTCYMESTLGKHSYMESTLGKHTVTWSQHLVNTVTWSQHLVNTQLHGGNT